MRAWSGPVAALAGATAVAAVAGARLLTEPGLLGSGRAEVYGHAWVQWWVAQAWPALPSSTPWLDPRSETPWRVIDPIVTWFAAGLATAAGPVAAWNTTALLAVAGAFLGGWFLAGRVGGERFTGGVTLAMAPAFAGALASGLTEDWALGLLAVALGLVASAWTPRDAVLAGLALGALAWTGLYLALMGALGAIVLGLSDGRARPRQLAIAAAVALAVALPAAALQGDRLGGETHRSGVTVEQSEAHWRVNPHRGADLATFVTPGPDPVEDDALIRFHPAYLGVVALILAAVGPGGRRWWALLAVTLLLAPGATLRWAGEPLGVANPVVQALSGLPLVGLVNHWGRFVLLGMVALSALASRGVARLQLSRGAAAPLMATMSIVADYTLLSPVPWPLPVADASVPEIGSAIADLPEGGVVVVPSAGPGVSFQRILYEQRAHGRPVFVHPNRPGYGAAEGVPLVRWFAGLPGDRKDPPDPQVDVSLRRLEHLGAGVILVREPYVADVVALLGPPDVQKPDGAAWSVP
jgi:hypothetical protein